MAEEPENHTVRLLQEMRDDVAHLRGDVAQLRTEFAVMKTQLDGNTLILNFLAGGIHNHDRRLTSLETAPRV